MTIEKYNSWNDIDQKTREYLRNKFTHINGNMRIAIDRNKIFECFVYYGPRRGIKGWAALHKFFNLKDESFKIGVFVSKRHRHKGTGTSLKKAAIKYSLDKYGRCIWYKDGIYPKEEVKK